MLKRIFYSASTVWALSTACALPIAEPGMTGGHPEWVERNGASAEFSTNRYLVGFAKAVGREEAAESAKQQAIGDLARQISVQIESNVVDITRETNGRLISDLTSQIRATSDIRLEGIRF